MKRLASIATATFVLAAATVAAAGSIRVYNSDSKSHTVELTCNGSRSTLTIDASKTTTYTFHSTASSCEITGGTITFPTKTLENNQSWRIKDGKATKE
jgi:plastocyanin